MTLINNNITNKEHEEKKINKPDKKEDLTKVVKFFYD